MQFFTAKTLTIILALTAISASKVKAQDNQSQPPNIICEQETKRSTVTYQFMNRPIFLESQNTSCEVSQKAFESAQEELRRLETTLSTTIEGADLFNVNTNAGKKAVKVDKELYILIELALGFAEMTDGAFDPTFASMDGLWNFETDEKKHFIPSKEQVDEKRSHVNYKNVILDGSQLTVYLKDEQSRISLGGIARGYAIDNIKKIIGTHQLKDFSIRSNNEIYTGGQLSEHLIIPNPGKKSIFASFDLQNKAYNISRDTDKSFQIEDKSYHHIIDPRTGYSATETRTVAVIAMDATTADALSTAIFVLGPKKGLKLAERRRGIETLIIGADNKTHISSGFGNNLQLGIK